MATLLSPVRLMDSLTPLAVAARGNTPRPSKSELLFISGMQDLDNKSFATAEEKLKGAVAEAEKNRASLEPLGMALCGLGFLYSCMDKYKEAEELYLRALGIWVQMHGENSPRL